MNESDNRIDQSEEEGPEENVEYIGNIWGWKFSFISLGIILFFLTLFIIQTCRGKI